MMTIEVGTRVKVNHKAEHDAGLDEDGVRRRLGDGRGGTVITVGARHVLVKVDEIGGTLFVPDELTPESLADVIRSSHAADEAPRCGDGAHLHSITESAAALDRAAVHWKREATKAKAAVDGWVARCTVLTNELHAEREARQAADALTATAQKEADDARMRLPRVAAAVSKLRADWAQTDDLGPAFDAVDRALAGVPAPVETTGEDWPSPPCQCGHNKAVHGRRGCAAVVAGTLCACKRFRWIEGPREWPAELTVGFCEWKGTARRLPTPAGEPRRWRLAVPFDGPKDWCEKTRAIGSGIGRDRLAATIGGWVGRVVVISRAPVDEGVMELELLEWVEPSSEAVAAPTDDPADLLALVMAGERRASTFGADVGMARLILRALRTVERRLVAVETRRPKVGPWVAPEHGGGTLQAFDERGAMLAQVHPNAGGGVEWIAAHPFEDRALGTAADYPSGCAAALVSLSSWCDVAGSETEKAPRCGKPDEEGRACTLAADHAHPERHSGKPGPFAPREP